MTNRFVFTDLHGNGEVWKQIKKFIGNQPTVFLGDAADRGTDGFRIIYEMKNMPNLTYLRGNHEELLIEAAREYMRDEVLANKFIFSSVMAAPLLFKRGKMRAGQ